MITKLSVASLILVAIVIGWYANEAICQDFVTDGLLGFWSLDANTVKGDVLKDVAGKNDGTIVGSPKSVQGKIKEALEFNGTTDYVKLPDMGNEPEVTVEAWALAHSLPPAAHSCCIGIVSSAPEDQWKAGTVHFKFEAGLITIDNNTIKLTFSGASTNEWYHAAYTTSIKENEFKLYVNGELINEAAANPTPSNLTHIRIASEHEGRYLPGIVDEVRIYKRALSEDEIAKNFNAKTNSLAVVDAKDKLAITWGEIKQF
jgi:hypothetical protein